MANNKAGRSKNAFSTARGNHTPLSSRSAVGSLDLDLGGLADSMLSLFPVERVGDQLQHALVGGNRLQQPINGNRERVRHQRQVLPFDRGQHRQINQEGVSGSEVQGAQHQPPSRRIEVQGQGVLENGQNHRHQDERKRQAGGDRSPDEQLKRYESL